jgi:two-component system cell cycle sensor histidine kinase/response regulator CckA
MDGKRLDPLMLAVIILLAGGIFVVDLHTPLGVADWIWYMIPLLLSEYLRRYWVPFLLAFVFSLLIIAGYYFSPAGGLDRHTGWVDRVVGSVVLWVVSFIKFKRYQVEARLRESEAKWKTLFDILPAGIAIVGPDRDYVKMNSASESLLGLGPGSSPGARKENLASHGFLRSDGSPMPADEIPSQRTIREQRVVLDTEVGMARDDGDIIWLSVSAAPLPGQKAAVVMVDISQRKLNEKTLAESEERYRRLFNEMTPGFALGEIIFDAAGHPLDCLYLEINPAFERLTGLKRKQALGRRLTELWPKEGLQWLERFIPVILTGQPIHFEQFFPALNRHFKVYGYLPAPRQVAVMVLDITERKQTEKTVTESEVRFRSAMQFSAIGMAIISSEGHFLEVNPALCEILGYAKEEMLSADFQSITHPEDLPNDLAQVDRMLKGEIETYELEKRCHHHAGHYIWAQLNVSLIWRPDGQSCYFVSQIQDITSRKLMLHALAESEERFRTAMQYSGIGMALISSSGGWLEVNPATCAMLGYAREEFLTSDFQSITHPEDLDICVREVGRLLQGQIHTFELQKRYRHKRGHYCWVQSNVSLIRQSHHEKSYLVVQMQDITERKEAADELFKSREMLRTILDNIPERVFWKDREGRFLGCNLLLARDCGFESPAGLIGKTDYDIIFHENAEVYRADDRQVMETNRAKLNFEERQTKPDGRTAYLMTSKVPLHDTRGRVIGILGTYEDITERKALETQFRQSQKMEAVGRLAGGIAHDFNNLITIISGYSDMLLGEMSPADEHRDSLTEIKKASDRAAALTRQLLAFSRKQVLTPDILDLNAVVQECETMFRRLLGEDVDLKTDLAGDLGRVQTDAGQLEQVLLNLVVNSRDAMPLGGSLIIKTANAVLDEAHCHPHHGLKPGRYAMLAVSDTGAGMDEKTRAQIFEPFFTTKHQGTGLGLAMVFSFIRQSGGQIEVNSKPGSGTSFVIYLPIVGGAANSKKPVSKGPEIPRGNETILLVEDQNDVRTLARHLLESRGYSVFEAANGIEALGVMNSHGERIDLLLSDVVMPGMGGRELAEKVVAAHPDMKVLFVSGYTDDAVMRQGISASQTNFLQKPFTGETLHLKVRTILGH